MTSDKTQERFGNYRKYRSKAEGTGNKNKEGELYTASVHHFGCMEKRRLKENRTVPTKMPTKLLLSKCNQR